MVSSRLTGLIYDKSAVRVLPEFIPFIVLLPLSVSALAH